MEKKQKKSLPISKKEKCFFFRRKVIQKRPGFAVVLKDETARVFDNNGVPFNKESILMIERIFYP